MESYGRFLKLWRVMENKGYLKYDTLQLMGDQAGKIMINGGVTG